MNRHKHIAVGEAARKLGISPQRVRQLVDAGRLPAERGPYRARLLDAEAVNRMAQERDRDRAAAAGR